MRTKGAASPLNPIARQSSLPSGHSLRSVVLVPPLGPNNDNNNNKLLYLYVGPNDFPPPPPPHNRGARAISISFSHKRVCSHTEGRRRWAPAVCAHANCVSMSRAGLRWTREMDTLIGLQRRSSLELSRASRLIGFSRAQATERDQSPCARQRDRRTDGRARREFEGGALR